MIKKVSWLYGGKRYYGTLIRETKTHKFLEHITVKLKRLLKRKRNERINKLWIV